MTRSREEEMEERREDLRIEVRVKNNLILTKMEEAGVKSVNALARQAGLSSSAVHCLVNMTTLPVTKERKWKRSVIFLADFLRCSPDDLFSEEQQKQALETNRTRVEISFAETQGCYALMRAEDLLPEKIVFDVEKNQCLKSTLATLTSRQQKVLALRFGLEGGEDMTFADVGKTLNISKGRAQQIVRETLRKLRRRLRAKLPKEFS